MTERQANHYFDAFVFGFWLTSTVYCTFTDQGSGLLLSVIGLFIAVRAAKLDEEQD